MSAKYRHVLPNLGHFAGYIMKKEPFGLVIPLVDRVLVTREVDGEPADMIVGTVIMEREYRIADEVPEDTKFMGYIDPRWVEAKGGTLTAYEEQLKGWGKTWQQRSTPVVIPAVIEELFDEPDLDDEEDVPTPPRRRRGR